MSGPIPFRHLELGYAVLGVTDPAASLAFHREIVGLEYRGERGGGFFLRCGVRDHCLVLEPAAEAGVRRVGWEVESAADLDAAFDHFAKRGYDPQWIDDDRARISAFARGFAIVQRTTGLCFEYFTEMARPAPAAPMTIAEIERLGHVVLSVERFDDCLAEMTGDMGFVVSDHVAGKVAFLRAWPNPLHHSFAIQASDSDHLQHINFMVEGIDTIGTAVNRLNAAEVPIVFGPGRHLPSGSIFLYFLDPDGLTFEYSAGMEEFPEIGPRSARELEPSLRTIDMWGGRPDPRFGARGHIGDGTADG